MNDGDWICSDANCGNINFARRHSCYRCNKEKPEAKITKKLGTEIGKTAAEKSRGLFNADDWQCSKCANVNWARRTTCNVCNAPKFGEVEARTGYGGGYNERGVVEYRRRESSSDDEYDEFGRKKRKRKSEKNETQTMVGITEGPVTNNLLQRDSKKNLVMPEVISYSTQTNRIKEKTNGSLSDGSVCELPPLTNLAFRKNQLQNQTSYHRQNYMMPNYKVNGGQTRKRFSSSGDRDQTGSSGYETGSKKIKKENKPAGVQFYSPVMENRVSSTNNDVIIKFSGANPADDFQVSYTIQERVFAAAYAIVYKNCKTSTERFECIFDKPAPDFKTIFAWRQRLLYTGCLVDSHIEPKKSADKTEISEEKETVKQEIKKSHNPDEIILSDIDDDDDGSHKTISQIDDRKLRPRSASIETILIASQANNNGVAAASSISTGDGRGSRPLSRSDSIHNRTRSSSSDSQDSNYPDTDSGKSKNTGRSVPLKKSSSNHSRKTSQNSESDSISYNSDENDFLSRSFGENQKKICRKVKNCPKSALNRPNENAISNLQSFQGYNTRNVFDKPPSIYTVNPPAAVNKISDIVSVDTDGCSSEYVPTSLGSNAKKNYQAFKNNVKKKGFWAKGNGSSRCNTIFNNSTRMLQGTDKPDYFTKPPPTYNPTPQPVEDNDFTKIDCNFSSDSNFISFENPLQSGFDKPFQCTYGNVGSTHQPPFDKPLPQAIEKPSLFQNKQFANSPLPSYDKPLHQAPENTIQAVYKNKNQPLAKNPLPPYDNPLKQRLESPKQPVYKNQNQPLANNPLPLYDKPLLQPLENPMQVYKNQSQPFANIPLPTYNQPIQLENPMQAYKNLNQPFANNPVSTYNQPLQQPLENQIQAVYKNQIQPLATNSLQLQQPLVNLILPVYNNPHTIPLPLASNPLTSCDKPIQQSPESPIKSQIPPVEKNPSTPLEKSRKSKRRTRFSKTYENQEVVVEDKQHIVETPPENNSRIFDVVQSCDNIKNRSILDIFSTSEPHASPDRATNFENYDSIRKKLETSWDDDDEALYSTDCNEPEKTNNDSSLSLHPSPSASKGISNGEMPQQSTPNRSDILDQVKDKRDMLLDMLKDFQEKRTESSQDGFFSPQNNMSNNDPNINVMSTKNMRPQATKPNSISLGKPEPIPNELSSEIINICNEENIAKNIIPSKRVQVIESITIPPNCNTNVSDTPETNKAKLSKRYIMTPDLPKHQDVNASCSPQTQTPTSYQDPCEPVNISDPVGKAVEPTLLTPQIDFSNLLSGINTNTLLMALQNLQHIQTPQTSANNTTQEQSFTVENENCDVEQVETINLTNDEEWERETNREGSIERQLQEMDGNSGQTPFLGDIFDPGPIVLPSNLPHKINLCLKNSAQTKPDAQLPNLNENAPVIGNFKSFALPKPLILNRLKLSVKSPDKKRPGDGKKSRRKKKSKAQGEDQGPGEEDEEDSGDEADLAKYDLWGSDEEGGSSKNEGADVKEGEHSKEVSESGEKNERKNGQQASPQPKNKRRSRSSSSSSTSSSSSSSSRSSQAPKNKFDDFNLNSERESSPKGRKSRSRSPCSRSSSGTARRKSRDSRSAGESRSDPRDKERSRDRDRRDKSRGSRDSRKERRYSREGGKNRHR